MHVGSQYWLISQQNMQELHLRNMASYDHQTYRQWRRQDQPNGSPEKRPEHRCNQNCERRNTSMGAIEQWLDKVRNHDLGHYVEPHGHEGPGPSIEYRNGEDNGQKGSDRCSNVWQKS